MVVLGGEAVSDERGTPVGVSGVTASTRAEWFAGERERRGQTCHYSSMIEIAIEIEV